MGVSKVKATLLPLREHIAEGYRNGNSLKTLALAYNASIGSIRKLLKEEGVQMRKIGRPRKEK